MLTVSLASTCFLSHFSNSSTRQQSSMSTHTKGYAHLETGSPRHSLLFQSKAWSCHEAIFTDSSDHTFPSWLARTRYRLYIDQGGLSSICSLYSQWKTISSQREKKGRPTEPRKDDHHKQCRSVHLFDSRQLRWFCIQLRHSVLINDYHQVGCSLHRRDTTSRQVSICHRRRHQEYQMGYTLLCSL